MSVRVLQGDCRDVLKTLPDESVDCVVTSPPYFGLRDYGVDGQLGLEESPQAFVSALVGVFNEVWRVLKADGTAWVNMGDSYNAHPGQRKTTDKVGAKQETNAGSNSIGSRSVVGLKPKDLIGVPWMLAFALRDAGWYLRQDIIWHKPNPMPESVTDRCTKSHEYIFLLSKAERYSFDSEAIQEPVTDDRAPSRKINKYGAGHHGPKRSGNKERRPASDRGVPVDTDGSTNGAVAGSVPWEGTHRNKRDVWTVPVKPFNDAHFATFPHELIEPCILAGCPEGGTVLDPFGGAGTTGLVADRHHRNAILIELNPDYADMAKRRIQGDAPLFAEVE